MRIKVGFAIYINQKPFSRNFTAQYKILILLKEHFTIN